MKRLALFGSTVLAYACGEWIASDWRVRLIVWQNGQHLNVAAIPCTCGCSREGSRNEPERYRRSDLYPLIDHSPCAVMRTPDDHPLITVTNKSGSGFRPLNVPTTPVGTSGISNYRAEPVVQFHRG